ncbi:hypothetical protein [Cellulomonas cellasea]|uniref:Septum formation initiator n=2 Tax=Cellulomonas cellasea TaxID=43670 RepID=A0A0A0B2W8_9CELL|nr:hypothetical protein [Cellulomonas cellasea]KGM01190.1 hypothetical protein Q760_03050 [Cellulomonas cellasea DSM 20118]GEA87713.1 hypothetical protein CCE01nite_16620 [Cellulomonas cellasea]
MDESGSSPAVPTARESAGATARRRLAVPAAWLAAVLLAGSVTGWAVSAVGGPGSGSVLSEAEVARRLAALPSTGSSPPATATPTTTATPAPAPTAAPPVTEPAVVARAWDVEGGSVGAACRGTVIELQYATPADGWAVEVKRAGPEEVEVELRSGDDRTSVRAACAADGTPQLHDDGDDGSSGSDDD